MNVRRPREQPTMILDHCSRCIRPQFNSIGQAASSLRNGFCPFHQSLQARTQDHHSKLNFDQMLVIVVCCQYGSHECWVADSMFPQWSKWSTPYVCRQIRDILSVLLVCYPLAGFSAPGTNNTDVSVINLTLCGPTSRRKQVSSSCLSKKRQPVAAVLPQLLAFISLLNTLLAFRTHFINISEDTFQACE